MKQQSIFALILGAILVLTISSTDVTFADYDRYDDDSRDDSDAKSEKERKS